MFQSSHPFRRSLPVLLAAFALANLTAYGRDAAVAGVFGASGRTDAYFVGAFLPTLLATVLVFESAVPALLPPLARLASDGAATAKLLRAVIAVAVITLIGVVALLWLAAEPVVRLCAPGWNPAQVGTAASLLRITAGALVPLGVGAVLAAALNVRHRYLSPPLGMAMINSTVVASALLLNSRLGIYAPAWGMLTGSWLYVALQLAAVSRLDLRTGPGSVHDSYAGVSRAITPTLIFAALAQNVAVVERWLASALPPGELSYLVYAGKLMMSPLLVITAAGGLLAFVAMSRALAAGDERAFRSSLVGSARVLSVLLAAATTLLVVYRHPVVELALQHGHFGARDAGSTAGLLAVYALGLVPNGLTWLLYRSLQARGRYWQTVEVALMTTAIYVGCAVTAFHVWGLPGIAGAFPVSQVASCLMLYAGQPAFLRVPLLSCLRFAARVAFICTGAALLLWAVQAATARMPVSPPVGSAVTLLCGGAVLLVALSLGMRSLRLPEGTLVHGWLTVARAKPDPHAAAARD